MDTFDKYEALRIRLLEFGKIAVGFSGGVDSTFLLKVAFDTLGEDNVLAITVDSVVNSKDEIRATSLFCENEGIRQIVLNLDVFDIENFENNPPDRCYICKKVVFSEIMKVAKLNGIEFVADGSNFDDINDYRPGDRAILELGVLSPLKEAQLTKDEIRVLSKGKNIPTWNKLPMPCFATRFPYNTKITEEKINMVESAEKFLREQGFKQLRVRIVNETARIEVAENERIKFANLQLMDAIVHKLEEIGFLYITLDLKGYRMGSMNEALNL